MKFLEALLCKLRKQLIHEANPQSRPVVLTIFARVVCTSVRPSLLFKSHKKKFQANSDRY